MEPANCTSNSTVPSITESSTARLPSWKLFLPSLISALTLRIRAFVPVASAKSTGASPGRFSNKLPRGGNALVGKAIWSGSMSGPITRIRAGLSQGSHVAPPSRLTSVKMSKKLPMRKFPSGNCRTVCFPSEARVGLSRSITVVPGPPVASGTVTE